MAKDPRQKQGAQGAAAETGKTCCAEDCKKPMTRAEYCEEHFQWFKEGLITKEGKKPRDFDKKYQAYLHRRKAA